MVFISLFDEMILDAMKLNPGPLEKFCTSTNAEFIFTIIKSIFYQQGIFWIYYPKKYFEHSKNTVLWSNIMYSAVDESLRCISEMLRILYSLNKPRVFFG